MKIFHAINSIDIVLIFFDKTGIRLNVLIAYNNIKGIASQLTDQYRDRINLLYLDSGAYSVYTGKSTIDVNGYLQYLRLYGNKFDEYFNLDDDFNDPEHNYRNQLLLENGLGSARRPIPVIHDQNDPFGEFERYAEMGHDYIAIGSAGSRSSKDQLLTQAKQKYPNVKIHLFGDLDRYLLEKHLPYSADSATWAHQSSLAGGIYYWRAGERKQYSYSVGGRDSQKGLPHIRKSPFWDEIEAFLLDKFGYEYKDLFDSNVRYILNFYFFTQYENYLNDIG